MMKMPLAVQLFITVAATVIMVLIAATWEFVRQLERGFSAYQYALERDRLDALAAAVTRTVKSAPVEAIGKREWTRLVNNATRRAGGSNLDAFFLDAKEEALSAPRRPGDPLRFADRVGLVAPGGALIAGVPNERVALSREIRVGDKTVARLVLGPMDRASDERELAWLSQLRERMAWTAGAAAAAALALSAVLARWWTRRIRRLADATGRIAAGDFSARLPAQGGDEIARLSGHVNSMASSLASLETSRRRWLSNVAHELRTPLTTLQGEIEALRDRVRPVDDTALASLHEEVLRLTRLTADLHQLAIAELDDFPLHREQVDLSGLLDQITTRWTPTLSRTGLALGTICAPDLRVNADPDRLTQVLDNLLANSGRYTDPGGKVVVTATRVGEVIAITVEDSAPGVPPDQLHEVFAPLYRSAAGRSREPSGSGLGLALARALVLAHRGTIEAAASSLGGLAITIRLPAET